MDSEFATVPVAAKSDGCGCDGLASRCFSERLAICGFCLYVVVEMLFYYSTVFIAVPSASVAFARVACETVAVVLALCSLLLSRCVLARPISLVIVGAVVGAAMLCSVVSGEQRIVQQLVLLLALGGVRFERIAKAYYTTVLVVVAAIVFLSLLPNGYNRDVIPNQWLVFSYGFGHPNSLAVFFFSSVSAMLYVNWNRRLWWIPTCLAIVVGLFCYVVLSCHAVAALLLAVFVASVLHQVNRRRGLVRIPQEVWVTACVAIPIVLLVGMTVLMASYDSGSELHRAINGILHSRPGFAHNYHERIGGVSVFGRPFVSFSSYYHSGDAFALVDCAYCYAMLVYGVLATAVFFVAYVIAVMKVPSVDKSNDFKYVLILCYAVYALVECHAMYTPTNLALPLLATALCRDVSLRGSTSVTSGVQRATGHRATVS